MSEQPYVKREMVYASAAPFAAAIDEWIAAHQRRYRSHRPVRDARTALGGALRTTGIEELARRTGMPAKSIRRYQTGESRIISIDNADRLAMALNVPLSLLTEEFVGLGEARKRWCREQVTA